MATATAFRTLVLGALVAADASQARTGFEVPIPVYTDEAWIDMRQKAQTSSQVGGVYYDHSWTAGLGRLYPWPVPTDDAQAIVLYTPLAQSAFLSLTAPATCPPGQATALRYALAVELAAWFGVAIPPQVADRAVSSLADLKRVNYRPLVLGFDPALLGGGGWGADGISMGGGPAIESPWTQGGWIQS